MPILIETKHFIERIAQEVFWYMCCAYYNPGPFSRRFQNWVPDVSVSINFLSATNRPDFNVMRGTNKPS